jgi:putative hydrolase of the HAD superfamily
VATWPPHGAVALLPCPAVVTTERIRTVVFDLDDTLIDEEATAHASLRAAAAVVPGADAHEFQEAVLSEGRRRWRAGPHYDLCAELGFASWEGLWSTFEGGHFRLDGLKRWAPSYRRETWRSVLAELGVGDAEMAAACAGAFTAHQRRGHPLLPGAETTVRDLAGRYRLALLTNGPPDIQRQKIDGTGLRDCFEAVFVSGEVGVAKPDPAVFDMVLEQLDATAASTVMIGDTWERDVLGARSAGWSAVWVSAGRPSPNSAIGVPSVNGVAEIVTLLDGPDGAAGAGHPNVKS